MGIEVVPGLDTTAIRTGEGVCYRSAFAREAPHGREGTVWKDAGILYNTGSAIPCGPEKRAAGPDWREPGAL
jgi:hypothetical protein